MISKSEKKKSADVRYLKKRKKQSIRKNSKFFAP